MYMYICMYVRKLYTNSKSAYIRAQPIVSHVATWNSVTAYLPASLGNAIETDLELRNRKGI